MESAYSEGLGSWRMTMMEEFPNKTWKCRAIDKLVKKIDMEATNARKPGSGCQEWGRTGVSNIMAPGQESGPPGVSIRPTKPTRPTDTVQHEKYSELVARLIDNFQQRF